MQSCECGVVHHFVDWEYGYLLILVDKVWIFFLRNGEQFRNPYSALRTRLPFSQKIPPFHKSGFSQSDGQITFVLVFS